MFGPHTPATILVSAASGLLLIVSISTPILRPIYFLSIDLSPSAALSSGANRALVSDLNGVIKLGLFGYCVQLGSQVSCSSPQFGYSFDPTSVVSLPSNLNLDSSTWLIKALTYVLILHPIASGLGFLSAISGLVSHFREFSRSRITTWLASIAATVALFAFVFDILAFSLAKTRINNTNNSNISLNAKLGNAIWITLAGWASLVLSGCFFCASRRILSRRQRAQSQSHLIRPELDLDYSKDMREQAEMAEQAREKGFTPKQSHTNLPAFAEYVDQDGRNQEHIPLNSFQPDDEMYTHHSGVPGPHDSEAVEGVGAGYGRRQRPALAHQPSVMSQATMYSHASHSQPPPMPPMPQPIQSYHNQLLSPLNYDQPSSPSNHNQSASDLYRNLPAHVTPASNSMNHPFHSNSMSQPPQSNSIRRHPQSLIPAGMPTTGGVIESDRTRPIRSSYASLPSSQTTAMPSAQMYGPLQTVDPSSLPSSQSRVSGLAYHPQSNLLTDPHLKPTKPEQLDDPASTNISGGFPPPTYQTNCNQIDSNDNQVPNCYGSTEFGNDGIVHHLNASFQSVQQSSRHDDPFTQTYDPDPQTRNAHLSVETAAGLAPDQSYDGCHFHSPDEYDVPSEGFTHYSASVEQPHSHSRNNSRRDLPQVPSLPPLPFILPPSSPLHPRNNRELSGIATAGSYDQINNSHTSPPVYK